MCRPLTASPKTSLSASRDAVTRGSMYGRSASGMPSCSCASGGRYSSAIILQRRSALGGYKGAGRLGRCATGVAVADAQHDHARWDPSGRCGRGQEHASGTGVHAGARSRSLARHACTAHLVRATCTAVQVGRLQHVLQDRLVAAHGRAQAKQASEASTARSVFFWRGALVRKLIVVELGGVIHTKELDLRGKGGHVLRVVPQLPAACASS